MSVSSLIDGYVAGIGTLRDAVKGLTAAQLEARPVPGKWSVKEVVCHLADFETIGSDRIKLSIALDEPLLPGYDENRLAAGLQYGSRDVQEELALIEAVRRSTARILRSVPAGAFERRGTHSEAGPMTVEALLRRITTHITHHVRFIDEKRQAMGAA
jgi:uncharacterized damage-inducible protein DinB